MKFLSKKLKLPRWLVVVGVIVAILLIAFLVLRLSGVFDDLAAVYVGRGDSLVAEGAYSAAMREYAYALSLKNLDGNVAYSAYLKRAEILQRKRNYDQAIDELEDATKLRSGRKEAWLMLGQTRLSARQTDAAVAALETARQRDPKDPNVLRLLGLGYFRQGQGNQAEDILRQAIAADPDNQAGYYYLALVLLNKNIADADQLIGESLQREGAFSAGAKQLRSRLDDLQSRAGQTEGTIAVEAYQKILRGWIYAEVGEYEVADRLAEEALLIVPDYRDAWVLQGFCEIERNDFAAAKNSLAQAAAIDPTYGQIAYLQAKAEQGLGRIEAAGALYSKALDLGYRQHQVYLDYANLLIDQSDYSAAEKQLRAAYKIDAHDISGGVELVYLLGKKNNKAQEGLEIALALDRYWQTNHTHALAALGYSLAGEKTAAQNLVDQVIARDSLEPLAYFVRGLNSGDQADFEKAIDRDFTGQIAEWAREHITGNK